MCCFSALLSSMICFSLLHFVAYMQAIYHSAAICYYIILFVNLKRSLKEKCFSYAPESGVRYDGVYRIENCWRKIGVQVILLPVQRFHMLLPTLCHRIEDQCIFVWFLSQDTYKVLMLNWSIFYCLLNPPNSTDLMLNWSINQACLLFCTYMPTYLAVYGVRWPAIEGSDFYRMVSSWVHILIFIHVVFKRWLCTVHRNCEA